MKLSSNLPLFVLLAISLGTSAQPFHGHELFRRNDNHLVRAAMNLEIRAPQGPTLPTLTLPSATPSTTTTEEEEEEEEEEETSSTQPTSTIASTSTLEPPEETLTPTTTTSTEPPTSTTSSSVSSRSSTPSAPRSTTSPPSQTSRVASNTRFASQGSNYNVSRSTSTTTETASTGENRNGASSFLQNKSAVAATIIVALLVVMGSLIFIAVWLKKKKKRSQMAEEDMWDEASMKEFSRPGAAGMPITPPPSAPVAFSDNMAQLGRSNTTVLPSQSAGAASLARARSRRDIEPEDEPDHILAMPPVAHLERPRDSAYDIVPAAPPSGAFATSAYASQGGGYADDYSGAYASGSGSGGLAPPKRAGDHTSYGSGLGSDPFAGTGFVDATRESTYGPGQAGRGAGYNVNASTTGGPQVGNQWPQGYDPYTGYSSQGTQNPYGGYGYAH